MPKTTVNLTDAELRTLMSGSLDEARAVLDLVASALAAATPPGWGKKISETVKSFVLARPEGAPALELLKSAGVPLSANDLPGLFYPFTARPHTGNLSDEAVETALERIRFLQKEGINPKAWVLKGKVNLSRLCTGDTLAHCFARSFHERGIELVESLGLDLLAKNARDESAWSILTRAAHREFAFGVRASAAQSANGAASSADPMPSPEAQALTERKIRWIERRLVAGTAPQEVVLGPPVDFFSKLAADPATAAIAMPLAAAMAASWENMELRARFERAVLARQTVSGAESTAAPPRPGSKKRTASLNARRV